MGTQDSYAIPNYCYTSQTLSTSSVTWQAGKIKVYYEMICITTITMIAEYLEDTTSLTTAAPQFL